MIYYRGNRWPNKGYYWKNITVYTQFKFIETNNLPFVTFRAITFDGILVLLKSNLPNVL